MPFAKPSQGQRWHNMKTWRCWHIHYWLWRWPSYSEVTENSFQYMTRITTVNILSATEACCGVAVANYCSEDVIRVWQSLRSVTVVSERMKPSISSLHVPPFPSCLSIYLLCFHPSEAVTYEQSLILCVSVLDDCSCHASRQIVSWQKDKAVRGRQLLVLSTSPRPAPPLAMS